ncbi:MAG: ribonuclease H-like domain-containing protein [Armatimonadota bacterium]
MLKSTFIHVPGIGYSTECKIWSLGALTWDDYLDMHSDIKLPAGKKSLILPRVEESVKKLSEDDYAYFSRVLPSKDHWRAVSSFGAKGDIAYLDIETTGCGYYDEITVIGLYNGYEMKSFVKGINLNDFPSAISSTKMIVTFFGSGFDLPFISRVFPDIKFNQLHVDLCFFLRRIGLTGGLKSIEENVGIKRCPEAEGLSGFDAVRMWNEYRRGSREALDLLLLYNKEDVVNMEFLLAHGCREIVKSLGLPNNI